MKAVAPDSGSKPEDVEEESGKMSFLEHLDELRRRLVHIAAYVGIGFLACWYFAPKIYAFLALPVTRSLPPGQHLVFTRLTEPFSLYIKVALLAGIFLTSPLILYEVWKFISPGLYRREKRYVIPFLCSAVLLFVGGGAFAYGIVLPPAYAFFLGLGADFTPMITVNEYMDLTNTIILGFGLIFEMPVIIAFLSMFGLVTASFLWRKSKYAILVIFVVAALLSPTPDAFNQMLYAAPMIVLYVISIGVAAVFGWRRKAKS